MAQCPECGPHGNRGKVALLYSWVDCLTCKRTKLYPMFPWINVSILTETSMQKLENYVAIFTKGEYPPYIIVDENGQIQ